MIFFGRNKHTPPECGFGVMLGEVGGQRRCAFDADSRKFFCELENTSRLTSRGTSERGEILSRSSRGRHDTAFLRALLIYTVVVPNQPYPEEADIKSMIRRIRRFTFHNGFLFRRVG